MNQDCETPTAITKIQKYRLSDRLQKLLLAFRFRLTIMVLLLYVCPRRDQLGMPRASVLVPSCCVKRPFGAFLLVQRSRGSFLARNFCRPTSFDLKCIVSIIQTRTNRIVFGCSTVSVYKSKQWRHVLIRNFGDADGSEWLLRKCQLPLRETRDDV